MQAGSGRRTLGLLTEHDFRWFWTGTTVSKFGNAVTSVVMPLIAVSTLQAGAFQVGLLQAATWLPWLLIGLPAGAWIDRVARRPVIVVTGLVSAVLLVSVPAAAYSGLLTLPHLVAVALLVGFATVFSVTAQQVYLTALTSERDLPEANAKFLGSEAAAQIAGPGAGGLLVQIFGAVSGLLVDAAGFLVATACVLRVRRRETRIPKHAVRPNLLREVGEGLAFLLRERFLRTLTAYAAVVNLCLTAFQTILVVFLIRTVGVSPGAVGALLAAMGTGGILGAAVASTIARKLGTARGIVVCQLCAAPFGLLIPLTVPGPGLALLVVGDIVLTAGVVAGKVISDSFRQSYCPPALLGRVTATARFINYGTMPIAAVIGGALGSSLGTRTTLWITMSTLAAAALVLLASPLRGQRDLPQRSSEAAIDG